MRAPSGPGLPAGTRIVADGRIRLWRGSGLVLGGSPWGVVRLAAPARDLVRRAASPGGTVPVTAAERRAADLLVARGVLHPVVTPGLRDVEVVVPAYGRPDLLDACLAALVAPGGGVTPDRVVVVDDASPDGVAVGAVAARHGVRILRHNVNRGPAAGRNTGLAATTAPVVAFVDADVTVTPGWLDALLPLFDDPRVGAVAPRVVPGVEPGRVRGAVQERRADAGAASRRPGLLARHEAARSALDMGERRELVAHGAPLGFLPSATLLVRRTAFGTVGGEDGEDGEAVGDGAAFDEAMRLGEDVDLVWRLLDGGWQVRYEPTAVVHHEMRLEPREWARRRLEYGTSAAHLDERHPGRLVPARLSGWNVAVAVAALAGRPRLAAAVAVTASGALARRLRASDVDPLVAPYVVAKGLLADGAAVGHALRREWWPLGWLALAAAPRSRMARAAAAAMLAPVALEWVTTRPDVDPARYALLRLAEDAAYGTGVILSAVRHRRPGVLVPEVRLPFRPQRDPTRPQGPGRERGRERPPRREDRHQHRRPAG